MKQRPCVPAIGHTAVCPTGAGPIARRIRAAGTAVILILLFAVAGCGTADHPQPAIPHRSAFSVLRSSPSVEDAIPLWVVRRLSESDKPPVLSAADFADARRVLPRQKGWLAPAPEGELCLVRVAYPLVREMDGERLPPLAGRLCLSETEAEAGRLFETQSLSTTFAKRLPTRVVGIVPDGVHQVTVRFLGGASRKVAVKRNGYETVVINPRSLSFVAKRGGRRRRYVISLPTVAGASPTPYRGG
jgi:hypothetical protein